MVLMKSFRAYTTSHGPSTSGIRCWAEGEQQRPPARRSPAPGAIRRARSAEIITRMNDLFEGELTEADLLSYNNHISTKMLENPVLEQQARTNSKEQFAPEDLRDAMMDAVVEELDSYSSIVQQVLSKSPC